MYLQAIIRPRVAPTLRASAPPGLRSPRAGRRFALRHGALLIVLCDAILFTLASIKKTKMSVGGSILSWAVVLALFLLGTKSRICQVMHGLGSPPLAFSTHPP